MSNESGSIVPKHVGLILDGNRRWATSRGLKSVEGHKVGAETFKKVSLAAFDRGVQYLTAYVFSTENWHRTKDEVSFLMKLIVRAVELHLDGFHQNNIKIVVLGDRTGIPKSVLDAIERTIQKTSANTGGVLGLCFNYGGKPEILQAVRSIVKSGVSAEDIDEGLLDTYMYEPEIPAMDLMIRTSGEHRTSGYMLWRADYAELYFLDKLWPDFTVEDFDEALADYAKRQRRFGK